MNDITAVYYTADCISDRFASKVMNILRDAISTEGLPLVHYVQDTSVERSHLNIYRTALAAVKQAETKYVALCEDDVLYPAEHFTHRPTPGVFAYNMSVWSIYTWVNPPIFSYKGRRNLYSLICERDLFIAAMEERFTKYSGLSDDQIDISKWAEPGKYEKLLGVTEQKTEEFYTNIPLVAFSHETALSYLNLGKRKKLGDLRVTALPHWGTAEEVMRYYQNFL